MARKWSDRVVESMPWLDPLADSLQGTIRQTRSSIGPPAEVAKDVLHGRWLGHPLHPALVEVPLGAWTTTLVLDLAGMKNAADASLAVGIVGAIPAALAGVADWSDTSGTDRRIGLLHALLNATGLAMNVGSLIMRRSGSRSPGIALSTLSLAVVNASAYLGGEMVYNRGIGVNHAAWDIPPTDFTPVADVGALQDGKPVRVKAGNVAVVLVKRGNDIFALDATCTHMGGPLDEGVVEDDTITCPWHGSKFDLKDGSVLRGPATSPERHFETRTRDGQVEVRYSG